MVLYCFKTVPNYIKLPTVIVTVECLDLFLITIFGFVNFNLHLYLYLYLFFFDFSSVFVFSCLFSFVLICICTVVVVYCITARKEDLTQQVLWSDIQAAMLGLNAQSANQGFVHLFRFLVFKVDYFFVWLFVSLWHWLFLCLISWLFFLVPAEPKCAISKAGFCFGNSKEVLISIGDIKKGPLLRLLIVIQKKYTVNKTCSIRQRE